MENIKVISEWKKSPKKPYSGRYGKNHPIPKGMKRVMATVDIEHVGSVTRHINIKA